MLPEVDPLGGEDFAGAEFEMQSIHRFRKAMQDMRTAAGKAESSDNSDGEVPEILKKKEKPKRKGQNEQTPAPKAAADR